MRGWQIARIAGIAIEINATWLFIFALLLFGIADDHLPRHYPDAARWQFWMAGTIATLLLFGSVIVHELAHSLVARRYGVNVSRITLFIFGGVAQTEGEPKTALSELWIAIAGPLASMAIGAVCLGAWWLIRQSPIEPVWGGVFRINGALNIALAAFNMLPGFPLDGGRVLRASIWHFTGDLLNSTRWATVLGRGLGYLMMFSGALSLAAGHWLNGLYGLGLGLLLNTVARGSYESTRARVALQALTVGDLMQPARLLIEATWPIEYVVQNYFQPYGGAALPVVHEGRAVGVLTAEAVRKVDRGNWPFVSVGQLMSPLDLEEGVIVRAAPATDALETMAGKGKDYLLVTDESGLAGILTRHDLAVAAQRTPA